jgi:hypothetical protein
MIFVEPFLMSLNETHDPALRSWVDSAQREGGDFPIQNLPFAVFRRAGTDESWRGGVAIGDQVVDWPQCWPKAHSMRACKPRSAPLHKSA